MKLEQLGELDQLAYRPTIIPGINCIKLSSPLAAQYEISAECNQNCNFCYNVWKTNHGNTPITLPSDKRWRVIEKLIALNVFEVIFSGGEPLLISEICQMVIRLKKENIRSYLITNGLLLTRDLAQELSEAGLGSIQISLHGSTPSIHNSITQNSKSFALTIKAIKNAIEAFTADSINVNMVLLTKNYHDIEPLLRFLSGIGVKRFSLGFLTRTGLATSKKIGVHKGQILEAFRTMIRVGRETGIDTGVSGGFPICLFSKEEQKEAMHLATNICDAGLNQIVISPSGEIRACVCLPQVLGNIIVDDPQKVWDNSPFLQSLRNFDHVPPSCYDCDLVSMCKGGCRASSYCLYGDLKAIDPILCN